MGSTEEQWWYVNILSLATDTRSNEWSSVLNVNCKFSESADLNVFKNVSVIFFKVWDIETSALFQAQKRSTRKCTSLTNLTKLEQQWTVPLSRDLEESNKYSSIELHNLPKKACETLFHK